MKTTRRGVFEMLAGAIGVGTAAVLSGKASPVRAKVMDARGVLTPRKLDEFSRMAFSQGAQEKLLICAPMIKAALNEWGRTHLMVSPMSKVLGVHVQQVQTPHGMWLVATDWGLEDKSGSSALSMDTSDLDLCRVVDDQKRLLAMYNKCQARLHGVDDYSAA